MRTNDLENELRSLKLAHLTENELVAYCDRTTDQVQHARIEVHLRQCFICRRQLELLSEERMALNRREVTAEDVALVERLTDQVQTSPLPTTNESARFAVEGPVGEWLVEYLRQMAASWRLSFGDGVIRRHDQAKPGEEVWNWQSDDGRFGARATIVNNADMSIHFISSSLALEGIVLNFRLGSFSQTITLTRLYESVVAAQVSIPWQYRESNASDISIEIV